MSLSYIKRAEQGNRSALAFIATILITFGGLLIGELPLDIAVYFRAQELGVNYKDYLTVDKMTTLFPFPVFFTLMMFRFVIMLLLLWFCLRVIHQRKLSTLWSQEDTFRKKNFFIGVAFTIVLMLGSDLINYMFNPGDYKWVFDAQKFFFYLPFALLLFPIQSLCEELFFRGYLYQGTGLLLRNKWLALIVSSILFGSVHFMNPEIAAFGFWKMAMVYIGSGLMIGLSVVLTGGIEFAFGFHVMNNLYLALIKSFPGSALQGPTLFLLPKPMTDQIVLEFLLEFTIFTCFIFIVFRKNVKELLNPAA